MSRETFQKKIKQKKLNKSMISPILCDPQNKIVNKIGTKMCQGL